MANIEEIKKIADEKGVELTEEMLESVAGGKYTTEEWTAMSAEDRIQAILDSQAIKKAGTGEYCKYLDKD